MKLEYKKLVYVMRYWNGQKHRYKIRNLDRTSSGYHYFDKLVDALNYCDSLNLEVLKIYN